MSRADLLHEQATVKTDPEANDRKAGPLERGAALVCLILAIALLLWVVLTGGGSVVGTLVIDHAATPETATFAIRGC